MAKNVAFSFPQIEKQFDEMRKKVIDSDETDFLKYLIDCCENVLESPYVIAETNIFAPVPLQLVKLRAEVTERLKLKFNTRYGRFAEGTHLLAKQHNQSWKG